MSRFADGAVSWIRRGRAALAAQLRPLWQVRTGRWLLVAAGVLLAGTAIGLAVLWPRGDEGRGGGGAGARTLAGEVLSVKRSVCEGGICRYVEVSLEAGPDRGRSAFVTLSPRGRAPDYDVGDRVRVLAGERQGGVEGGAPDPGGLPGASG